MRHRLFIPAATALLFALAACTQDELAGDNRLPEGEYPVVIRATGLSVEATPLAAPSTRAAVDGDWQGVTSVALKMGDAVKEYTVTASTDFKSATLSRENDPYYWTSRDPITVSAWWPFNNADITQMPAVKVAEDQSKLADFQNSDFISAENRKVEFNNPTLEFTHRTARVTIELKPGTGFTSVAGATVSLVSLSADNGNPTAIKTYNASGNTYEALTAPQTVAAGKPFVKVELGGGTFYFRPQNNVVLEAGSRYKYTVKVNATGLTLEGCTIGSWADGGGESGAAEDLGYSIQNDGSYMVYNADGLMNGHGSPHTYGNTALLSRFECENLSKAAYIQPLLTGQAGIFLRILSLFHGLFGPVAEAFAAVITAVAGLDKDALSQVLHPVADFAFDTHVRNLTKTVVVRAGAVAVQGVAVGVCHADADQRHERFGRLEHDVGVVHA